MISTSAVNRPTSRGLDDRWCCRREQECRRSYLSPVVSVPDGSNIVMAPPAEADLCSTPHGTTKMIIGAEFHSPFRAAGLAQGDVQPGR